LALSSYSGQVGGQVLSNKKMKRTVKIIISFLILAIGVCTARAEIKNPDTLILATYGTLRTLDPAACYDTTGSQRIWNIYESLVFFDGSKTDAFIAVLTTRVPTLENGGISADGITYTFRCSLFV
jgi:peptide/nickel transport system substrate-binding protein